ncbi:hypothetical protein BGZ76_002768, partial [Entomortierella beljakovae]
YLQPRPLLRTLGADWVYQPDPSLYKKLGDEIRDHYSNFCLGKRDKTTTPLYLFLRGAGTGKSRNAQELHKSMIQSLSDEKNDTKLKQKIENAWVFHVSLENVTSLMYDERPLDAIGCRMLLQLLPGKELTDIFRNYLSPTPVDVLRLLALNSGQDLESATVVLVVDGLQSFMTHTNDGLNKESRFYSALTNIGDLAFGNSFITVCCTATVSTPVDQFLVSSHRKRVVLPVASLEPPSTQINGITTPVFNESDHIIKVLVNDCGGHRRALESLQEAIAIEAGDGSYNVESLMNRLYSKLRDRYSEAIAITSRTAEAIARATLTRTLLQPDSVLPGTNKTPDTLAIPGLVTFEQPNGMGAEGYLTAPYIWIWLLSYQPKEGSDPLLKSWRFRDYSDLKAKVDPRSPPGAQFWQHFEHFIATFRCLRSRVISEDYLAERTKAASNDDFFILFTSQDNLNVNLPPCSGIVDGSNWNGYFGPFAGRALIFATVGALDINNATHKDLKGMRGIGKLIAKSIIDERTKRPFESLEDACKRLPRYRRLFKDFNYSRVDDHGYSNDKADVLVNALGPIDMFVYLTPKNPIQIVVEQPKGNALLLFTSEFESGDLGMNLTHEPRDSTQHGRGIVLPRALTIVDDVVWF